METIWQKKNVIFKVPRLISFQISGIHNSLQISNRISLIILVTSTNDPVTKCAECSLHLSQLQVQCIWQLLL